MIIRKTLREQVVEILRHKILSDLNEKLNSGFGPNARVNSI